MGRTRKEVNSSLPANILIKKGVIYFTFRYMRYPFHIHQKYCAESVRFLQADDPDDIRQAGKWIAKTLEILKLHDGDFAKYFPTHKLAPEYGRVKQKIAEEISLKNLVEMFFLHKDPGTQTQTAYSYTSAFNKMKSYLGENVRVASLSSRDMDTLRIYFFDNLAKGTANSYLKNIRALLRYAKDYGYLLEDLTPFLKGIPVKQQERQEKIEPLEINELDIVSRACQKQWQRLMIKFWVYSGLRPGEIYSLAWEDIDLTEGKVTVQRSMEVKRMNGYPLFKLPKHDKIRTIYLNKAALAALREMRELTQASKRMKIKVFKRSSKNQNDYKTEYVRPVFRRENDHPTRKNIEYEKLWLSHSSWRKTWEAILRRARISYRSPRQLRHTFACWSLSARVELSDLRDILGHTSVTILEKHYAKWMKEAQKKEAERNSELLEEAGYIK